MEARVIITTELQLKAIVADAVSAAFKYYQPPIANLVQLPAGARPKIDFDGLKRKYYPGIPESTVRQDTAVLSKTKIGRRVLFDEDEVQEHIEKRHRKSAKALSLEADQQFDNQHQRKGGRKSA